MNRLDPNSAKQMAAGLIQQGNITQAKHLVGQLHQALPNDPQVVWLIADVFEAEGHRIDAAVFLKEQLPRFKQKEIKIQFLDRAATICADEKRDKTLLDLVKVWRKLDAKAAKARFFEGLAHARLSNTGQAYRTLSPLAQEMKQNAWVFKYLGDVETQLWALDEALTSYAKAAEVGPHEAQFRSLYMYTLNTLPESEEARLFQEHADYGALLESKAGAELPLPETPKNRPEKLRIGFSGSEFRTHSVAYFFLPILRGLDRSRYEVICFSDCAPEKEDAVSEEMKSLACEWFDSSTWNADHYAKQIQEARIDIFVDLNAYTGEFRLNAFAKRPAPVQVTYLGYPNTSGLSRMDYRLTDAIADPEGMTEQWHTETLVRLPGGFLCFEPDPDAPELALEVKRDRPGVCFGSFNAVHKINDTVLDAWAQILNQVEGSYLLIKNKALKDPEGRKRLEQKFRARGISKDRIEMWGTTESREEHIRLYERVDLHLDSFPYNGTTTTCEALWQGVATVTFAGSVHRSRVSTSILERVGLQEFVAQDVESYIKLAVSKVQDLTALAALRSGMRERMQASDLMNVERFNSELSEAFETMYQAYLDKEKA